MQPRIYNQLLTFLSPPLFHWSDHEGLRKPTQIMSKIDGESGADESGGMSGGEGEWRALR